MKVVHIITGLAQGGAESALYRLVTNRYNDSSLEHVVVSLMDMGVYGKQLQDNGIAIYAIGMKQSAPGFKTLYRLWKLIRALQPDVIQTWMYHADLIGGIVGRLAGCRSIVWGIVNFNLSPEVAGKSTRWTAKACAIVSGFVPSKIISCSGRAAEAHQAIGYSKNKLTTIPLGYDLDEFKKNDAARVALRRVWGIEENARVIGCVARWNHQKDHPNLLRALAMVRNKFPYVYCVLAGPWMDRENKDLMQFISSINGEDERILTIGKVDSIPDTMSAIDLHILPSLGEAFPNVVAEAMSCETPCIVTDVGDAATIVDDKGWVVPPADSTALAAALETALNAMENVASWTKRKNECRERIVNNYSMSRMMNSYKTVWQDVARKS